MMTHGIHTFFPLLQQRPAKPEVDWLSKQAWNMACDLNDNFEEFKGIQNDLTQTPVFVTLGKTTVSRSGQNNGNKIENDDSDVV